MTTLLFFDSLWKIVSNFPNTRTCKLSLYFYRAKCFHDRILCSKFSKHDLFISYQQAVSVLELFTSGNYCTGSRFLFEYFPLKSAEASLKVLHWELAVAFFPLSGLKYSAQVASTCFDLRVVRLTLYCIYIFFHLCTLIDVEPEGFQAVLGRREK